MGTAREMLKKQTNKQNSSFLHKAGTGEHPQRGRCPGLFPVFFLHFSLCKVLAMNSGQVWLINRLWGERGQGRPGTGKNQVPPTPGQVLGGLCTGRTHRRDCLQGALWSHAAYGKYLHAFTTLGLGALSCQVDTWGTLGPSALRRRLWAQSQRL